MPKHPKVSIIIPVYNTEDAIEECIISVLKQTEFDLEIILVNDGSTDRSGEICDRFAESDSRIRVIHQENRGPGPARNRGIDEAKGEYLYFLDSDDRIKETLIEENYSLAEEHHSDIVIFGYIKTEEGRDGKTCEVKTELRNWMLNNRDEIKNNLADILDDGATFAVWNKLFRRELISRNGIRYPLMRRNQDMAFTLDVLKHTQALSVNSNFYYHYSFDPKGFKYDENLIEHHLIVYNKFYNLFENWMDEKKNRQYAVKMFVLYFFHSVPFFIISHDSKPIEKLRELYSDLKFTSYLSRLEAEFYGNKWIWISLKILKMESPRVLYTATKIKMVLSEKFGKDRFRKLAGRSA